MLITTKALNYLISAVILTLHRERQFQLEAAKFECLYRLWLFLVDQISISCKKHCTCHISRIFYTGVYFVKNGIHTIDDPWMPRWQISIWKIIIHKNQRNIYCKSNIISRSSNIIMKLNINTLQAKLTMHSFSNLNMNN